MQKVFLILFIVINTLNIAIAQSNKINTEDFCKEWIWKKGWFDQNEIILEKKNIKIYTSVTVKFVFHNDGQLIIETHYPKNVGVCGNGLLQIGESKWYFSENELILDIQGSHIAADVFHYKMIYNVNIEKNMLTLKKIKTLIADVKRY